MRGVKKDVRHFLRIPAESRGNTRQPTLRGSLQNNGQGGGLETQRPGVFRETRQLCGPELDPGLCWEIARKDVVDDIGIRTVLLSPGLVIVLWLWRRVSSFFRNAH